jgi:hypothetical protein
MGAVLKILLVASHEEEQERLLDVLVAENGGRKRLRHTQEYAVAWRDEHNTAQQQECVRALCG